MNGSRVVFFSMLLWPALQLATTYFTVEPTALAPGAHRWASVGNPESLLVFLATGVVGFFSFFSLVESSWHFSYERQTGTMELLFLAPVNRLVLILANGVGALVQNIWLFLCFAAAMLAFPEGIHMAHPAMMLVAFLALVIPAVAWGTLLNSLLVFSRDSALLYTLLEDPMRFLSGSQVPLFALPTALAAIGWVFPLTTSLAVVRSALTEATGFQELVPRLLLLALLTAGLLIVAKLLLVIGERRAQRTGQLRLF
jgi:ABC-2 type transport system permease protein